CARMMLVTADMPAAASVHPCETHWRLASAMGSTGSGPRLAMGAPPASTVPSCGSNLERRAMYTHGHIVRRRCRHIALDWIRRKCADRLTAGVRSVFDEDRRPGQGSAGHLW